MSVSSSHNLAQTTLNKSVLFVNVKELNLNLYNEIIISWNIIDSTSLNDWIGVYKPISTDPNDSLDCQTVSGSKIGHLTWPLDKLKKSTHSLNEPYVEFRYYSGSNPQSCLAKSVSLKVIFSGINSLFFDPLAFVNQANSEQFVTFRISDLKAAQLRKGMFFNPDPYIKISVLPSTDMSTTVPNSSQSLDSTLDSFNSQDVLSGYAREYKTFVATNTCFPNWKNENFLILSKISDRLLIEVKDKFARTRPSINRFLGRVILDLDGLIDKARLNRG